MFNFYRRFIPGATKTLALLNNFLQQREGENTMWTPQAERAFETSRESMAQTVFLAHSRNDAELALFTNASDYSVGAALQR